MDELKPCPLCGSEPRRNGRVGSRGGVLCTGPANDHRVQAYGVTQADADTAWNTRSSTLTDNERLQEAEKG